MMIAGKILNPAGYFEILKEDGTVVPAVFNSEKKILEPVKEGEIPPKATEEQIKAVAALRIRPLLTDNKGNIFTLEEKQVALADYLKEHKQTGYAKQPLKLFYAILPNSEESEKLTAADVAKDISKADLYIFPVSGYGLWAPIYGYLAVAKDGDAVVGTTWYEMAEMPGLGANIAEPKWQKQFYGKLIFREQSEGKTDFQTAPMGIIVVKGRVQDVYGSSPTAKSAVDGISGSTLTGNGVTAAYSDSLTPYRALLIKIHEAKK